MKRTDRAAQPQSDLDQLPSSLSPTAAEALAELGRLTQLLDSYACEKQGYDPYDTTRNRRPDIWRQKRKRA